MIGPVPGMKNYWVAVGVMAGFCQAGGVGLCMAEWMIEGEPLIDVWAMDIARFGDFATAHARACSRPPPPTIRTFMNGCLLDPLTSMAVVFAAPLRHTVYL